MNEDNYNPDTVGTAEPKKHKPSIGGKGVSLLAEITANYAAITAPLRTDRVGTHYEYLIGIGKDHTASITLTEEALEELQKTNPEPTAQEFEEGKHGNTFGHAIDHLRTGGIVARKGWNGAGMYVFKQAPSKVPAHVVPNMSSLPDAVKERMQHDKISPDYQNQMAIVKPDGSIDSWVASSADTFATDWVLL